MTPTHCLLVEDDPLFSQWVLSVMRGAYPRLNLLTATDLAQALPLARQVAQFPCHIVILDMNLGMESGVDIIGPLLLDYPQAVILMLTSVETPHKAFSAIRAGAQGYVLKTLIDTELLNAVGQILAGGSPITPSIARLLLSEFRTNSMTGVAGMPATGPDASMQLTNELRQMLTPRETEVLRLLARGYTDKEAAGRLDISSSTVDTHVRSIYRKLKINSRVELRRLLTL